MNPKFWGSGAWLFLHSITMNYPKEPTDKDKQIYSKFFKDLQNIIPCDKCGYNYGRHLKDHPIEKALGTRETMIQWLIKIHNEVNKELGYPIYTYDQVIEEYQYKMNHIDSDEHLVYKVIILGLLVFIFYKYWKK